MTKKGEISKFILGTLAAAGLITVAVVAPNLLSALGNLGLIKKDHKRFNKKQLYDSLSNLKRNGLISVQYQGDKIVIKLTKNGKAKVLRYKLEDMVLRKPKRWDKKWRLVIYDIPEKYKTNRNTFVDKLRELEFLQLNRSVWISPYECEDEIDFLKEIYLIRKYVRIITAEKVDVQKDLIKYFSLK